MRQKITSENKLSQLIQRALDNRFSTTSILSECLFEDTSDASLKSVERLINQSELSFIPLGEDSLQDEHARPAKRLVLDQLLTSARSKRHLVLFAQELTLNAGQKFLAFNDARSGRRWISLKDNALSVDAIEDALNILAEHEQKEITLIPSGPVVSLFRQIVKKHGRHHQIAKSDAVINIVLEIYSHGQSEILDTINQSQFPKTSMTLSHLDNLEAEAIYIMREVMAEAENPVMLYSIGKDSSVMLHLARKAFYPSPPPFPLLHVDTRWKFQAMYDFRDFVAQEYGMELLVHINPEGIEKNINPFDHGSSLHTDIMKTQSLKMALDHYGFDVAFGGARRDEEKSRAKERVFSFRTEAHRWDPKNQRPELWKLYNGKKSDGESIRVFPISNWTELDIWQYIFREQIPIVPLYFAAERPVVERDGMLMMVDDDRLPLHPDEKIELKKIRFRTLGCYPLTGAIESDAYDLSGIILELLNARTSERQGRTIDTDSNASMEMKKQEGYF